MFDRLEATEQRFDDLTDEMARPEVSGDYEKLQALAKERASIEDVVTLYREWKATGTALDDVRGLSSDADPEMAALGRDGGAFEKQPGRRLLLSGIKHPMKVIGYRDGKKILEWEVTELQYFNKLDDSVFARPGNNP